MVFRVTEYAGYRSGRPFEMPLICRPLQAQIITPAGSVSTLFLSTATSIIFVDTDVATLVLLTSTGSTVTPSSGSSGTVTVSTAGACQRIPANVAPIPIYVQSPYTRLVVSST